MSQVSEAPPAPPAPPTPSHWKRFLPRFSLRTLLILVFLTGSVVGLGVHLSIPPWIHVKKVNGIFAGFRDGQTLLFHEMDESYNRRTVAWGLQEQRIVETGSSAKRPEAFGRAKNEFQRSLLLPELVSPDGKLVLLESNLGFSLWNIDTGESVLSRPMNTDGGRQLYDADFLRDSAQKIVVFEYTAMKDDDEFLTGNYRIYSAPEWTPGDPVPWSSKMSRAGYPLVSPSSNTFAVQSPEGGIRIFDLATNAVKCDLNLNGEHTYSWCFSRDGTMLIAYTTSGNIWRCDTVSQTSSAIATVSPNKVLTISVDGEQKRLLLCCSKGLAKIVDARTGDTLCTLRDQPVRKKKGGFSLQEGGGKISDDGKHAVIVYPDPDTLNFDLYVRARPEQWWGIAWLPELWLTLAFFFALLWSLWRDFKTLGAAKAA